MEKANNIRYIQDINNNIELIICDNSKISYPIHNHVSVYTIGIVLDGSILLNIGQESYVYNKDKIFAIPPYMPHSIHANDKYTLLSLCIHKSLFNNCDTEKNKTIISNLLIGEAGSKKLSHRQITRILNCFYSLNNKSLHMESKSEHSLIGALKQQLELFPDTKLSVDEMAKATCTSKYHFIRNFKQEVGLTPHQFQIQNRIRKAQRLINEIETITEVALSAGFYDQSHFIKHFEKYIGLTPTGYKMSCTNFNLNAGN